MSASRGAVILVLTSFSFIVAFSALPSFGQSYPATGTPPFNSFGGGPFDIVNLGNLDYHFAIPVFSRAGRGISFYYNLSYDSFIYTPVNGKWSPVGGWGWQSNTDAATGWIPPAILTSSGNCGPSKYYSIYAVPGFIDPLGAYHHAPLSYRMGCGGTDFPIATTADDGSGYTVTLTSSASGYITSRRGVVTNVSVGVRSGAATITDPNGNQITTSDGVTFYDTLSPGNNNTPVLAISGTNPVSYAYTGPSGSVAYKVNYGSYNIQSTNFGCSNISQYTANGVQLISSIELPDNSSYTFHYETNGGYYTGRLLSITLPSGGTITYSYPGGVNCADGSALGLTRTLNPGGEWTYARSGSGTTWTTTVVDPAQNYTVINFVEDGATNGSQNFFETHRKAYQGGTGGTLLETTAVCYNADTGCPSTPSTTVQSPITEVNAYRQFNGGLWANVDTKYNSPQTGHLPYRIDRYDFGGSLLQRTLLTYTNAGNPNISALPACVQVGGSMLSSCGTLTSDTVSQTNYYNYDSAGNVGSISNWVSGSSNYLIRRFSNYSHGLPQTFTDVSGAQTTYTYGDRNSAFPTTIAYPLSLSTSMQWDCNGGVVTSTTDANGNATRYSYNDPLWRLTKVSRPDGGSTSYSYNEGTTSISTTTAVSSTQNETTTLLLDGFGRTVQLQSSDPNSSNGNNVNTVYNNLGQVYSVTNPYFTASDPTYGLTTYGYDALGRATSVTPPMGDSINISYNGPAYQVQQYPNHENIIKIYQTDGLGRIIDICEATSQTQADQSAPGPCNLGINPTTKGFLATASYDALGNLTGLSYGATAQNRAFTYDGLSRMKSATYPESGTTTYTYDASPYQGNLTSKTFPAPNQSSGTVTATYSWDALNRFSCLSYSDGTTPGVCATYDQSTSPSGWPNNLGGSSIPLANGKGRLSWLSATNFTGVDAIFGYDPMGRVNTYAQCTPAGCNNGIRWVMNYQYNYIGEPAGGATIGGGNTWTNTYNPIGQLTQIWDSCLTNNSTSCTSSGDVVSGITYNALGQPTSDLLGNGFQEGWNYDKNGRVVSYNPGGTSPYGYWLTWNPATITASGDAVNGNYNYSYDSFGRVTCMYNGSACTSSGSTEAMSWGYDRWGNRWQQNVVAGSGPSPQYSFNQNNQFASGNRITYDAAGNIINDSFHTYKYDAASRLIAVDGGNTATYSYNSRGLRVQRYVGSSQGEKLFDLSGFPVADMAPGSTNMYFGDIYSGGRHWATNQWYGSGGTTMYLLSDWLGNLRMWKDESGNTDLTCSNFPFGDNKNCVGGFSTPWGVFGDANDSEDNTYHTQYRQYSPTQGRWLTPDPAGLAAVDPTNPQTWNRYAYVINNPTSYIDPSGLYLGYPGSCSISGDSCGGGGQPGDSWIFVLGSYPFNPENGTWGYWGFPVDFGPWGTPPDEGPPDVGGVGGPNAPQSQTSSCTLDYGRTTAVGPGQATGQGAFGFVPPAGSVAVDPWALGLFPGGATNALLGPNASQITFSFSPTPNLPSSFPTTLPLGDILGGPTRVGGAKFNGLYDFDIYRFSSLADAYAATSAPVAVTITFPSSLPINCGGPLADPPLAGPIPSPPGAVPAVAVRH